MANDETVKAAGINTRLAHSGNDPHAYFGFVNPPVVHASTVLVCRRAQRWRTRDQKYTYGTRGTPTTDALGAAIDELEGSAGTVMVPSGLAAVTLPLLAFLSAGDHVLIVEFGLFPDAQIRQHGVEAAWRRGRILRSADRRRRSAALMKPNTKLVFTESPGSNTFEMQDIPAIAKAAHAGGAIVMMDNTWATPLYFKALDHGVDVIVHASTKYPAGHSDVLLGTVSANAACWPQLYETFLTLWASAPARTTSTRCCAACAPWVCRLERHQKSALEIARWLEARPGVARVLHPALESHPGHAIWKRDFSGSSGIFSVVLDGGGQKQAHAFLNALKIFGLGYSWGGYESLAVPVCIGDRVVAKGPYGGPIIRLQIGLEDDARPEGRHRARDWPPRRRLSNEGQEDRRQYRHTGYRRGQELLPGRARPRHFDGSWLHRHLWLERRDEGADQLAEQGGSGTPVPDLSIEVDDVDAALEA